MARSYIRSGIGKALLQELVPPNRRVLINPGWKDLAAALAALQQRCRKHVLPLQALQRLYEAAQQEEDFFSRSLKTAEECPSFFTYDLISTQAAACRLLPGLTAFILERTATPPGDEVTPLIYGATPSHPGFDAGHWLEGVLNGLA